MVISDVTIYALEPGPFLEERVISVGGGSGSGQVSSLAEPCFCIKQLIEEPSGLREERMDHRVSRAEEVEENEVFDR
jgi:hypothetical protein